MCRLGVWRETADVVDAVRRMAACLRPQLAVDPATDVGSCRPDDLLLASDIALRADFPTMDHPCPLPLVLLVVDDAGSVPLPATWEAVIVGLIRRSHFAEDLAVALELHGEPCAVDPDAVLLASGLVRCDRCEALSNDRRLAFAAARRLRRCLQHGAGVQPAWAARLSAAAFECLENAMFHGNLELSTALQRTGAVDAYAALCEQRQRQQPYRDRRVWLTTRLTPHELQLSVRDEGLGFDIGRWEALAEPAAVTAMGLAGRGWRVLHRFCDAVRYNATGTEVSLQAALSRSCSPFTSPGSRP